MQSSLTQYIHERPLILDSQTPCKFVAKALRERDVGSAILTRGDRLVGIITDRDLACNLIAEGLSADTPASEVMTEGVQLADGHANVEDLLKTMEMEGVRRIPVVKDFSHKHQHLIGVVSLDDLILDEAVTIQQAKKVIEQQVQDNILENDIKALRHRARREQKYNEFKKKMANATATDLYLVEEVYKQLLRDLVQRLPAHGATQFVAQLPALLQEELLSVRAGPDRHIKADSLVQRLMTLFDLDEFYVRHLIQSIWSTLGEITHSGELDDVLAQLPNDFVQLLTGHADRQDYYAHRVASH